MIKIVEIEKINGDMVRVFLVDEEDKKFQHSEIAFLKDGTLFINNFNSYKFTNLVDGIEKVDILDIYFD